MLQPEVTLEPDSSVEFAFRFTALDPGNYSEEGYAVVDGHKFPFTLQARVRGTNPADWRPGISLHTQVLLNDQAAAPAIVHINAINEVNKA